MSENNNATPVVVGIVVLVLIAAGAWMWTRSSNPGIPKLEVTPVSETSATLETSPSAPSAPTAVPSPKSATVTYTDQGFSPSEVTVAKGGRVTFINQSSRKMWVGSNVHPLHTGYDGTPTQQHCAAGATPSFDECAAVPAGGTYSFVFEKTGSWGYHNHALSSDGGVVIVTAQ